MNEISRRYRAAGGSTSVPDGFSRAAANQLQARTNSEVAAGIIMNTRLSVAHFVTSTALNHATGLAHQAYALGDGDEYLASRLGALVDGYVRYAHEEIASLRRLA